MESPTYQKSQYSDFGRDTKMRHSILFSQRKKRLQTYLNEQQNDQSSSDQEVDDYQSQDEKETIYNHFQDSQNTSDAYALSDDEQILQIFYSYYYINKLTQVNLRNLSNEGNSNKNQCKIIQRSGHMRKLQVINMQRNNDQQKSTAAGRFIQLNL